jgi:hypothetical protein
LRAAIQACLSSMMRFSTVFCMGNSLSKFD